MQATDLQKRIGDCLDSAEGVVAVLRDCGVHTLILGGCDVNGEFRSKRFSLAAFDANEVEVGFSDYLFGCDVAEVLSSPREGYRDYFPTESSGVPDVYLRPDWSTLRLLSWDPGTALAIGAYFDRDGLPLPICPRTTFHRAVDRLHSLGFEAHIGVEFEVMIFEGSLRAAKAEPAALQPLSTGATYSNVRGSLDDQLLGPLRRHLDATSIQLESSMPETVPGQSELTLRYRPALVAADSAFLFKHFVRELIGREGHCAAFIACHSANTYGSSGHIHLSLRHAGSDALVMLDEHSGALSGDARSALAGVLSTLREFTSFYAPFVNSYRRFQKDHAWAGNSVSWGVDNRSCGVRVLATSPASTRFELRVPGADMNPYIAIAALLSGAAHGLEHGLEPPDPVEDDAFARDDLEQLPDDLPKAIEALDASALARELLGREFVEFYAETRFADAEAHRLALTEWEIARYLG